MRVCWRQSCARNESASKPLSATARCRRKHGNRGSTACKSCRWPAARPRAMARPAPEAGVGRTPRTEAVRQIPPRHPRAQNVKDRSDHDAIVPRRPTPARPPAGFCPRTVIFLTLPTPGRAAPTAGSPSCARCDHLAASVVPPILKTRPSRFARLLIKSLFHGFHWIFKCALISGIMPVYNPPGRWRHVEVCPHWCHAFCHGRLQFYPPPAAYSRPGNR